jgi:osmotically-inducible protein OsmY
MKHLPLTILLLASVLITGCVPVVFMAGGAAAGSGLVGDHRSLQTIADDDNSSYLANLRLSANKELHNDAHVSAVVFNHELLLVGQAPTEELKIKAEDLVKSVKKVKKVYNQITIGEPIGTLANASDAMLTTNIKTRMMTTTNLKSNQFKVVTEDKVVYLLGLTTKRQAQRAVIVARNSSGVKRVVTLFHYVE